MYEIQEYRSGGRGALPNREGEHGQTPLEHISSPEPLFLQDTPHHRLEGGARRKRSKVNLGTETFQGRGLVVLRGAFKADMP